MRLARKILPSDRPKTLEALARMYGTAPFVPHRALPDAEILLRVFGALLAEPAARELPLYSGLGGGAGRGWPP